MVLVSPLRTPSRALQAKRFTRPSVVRNYRREGGLTHEELRPIYAPHDSLSGVRCTNIGEAGEYNFQEFENKEFEDDEGDSDDDTDDERLSANQKTRPSGQFVVQQNLSFEDSDDEDSDENHQAHTWEAGESDLETTAVVGSSMPVVPVLHGAEEQTGATAPDDEQTNTTAVDVEQTNITAPDVGQRDGASLDVEQTDTAVPDVEQRYIAAPAVAGSNAPEIESSVVGGGSGSRTTEESEQQSSPECTVAEPKITVTSVVAGGQTTHTRNGRQTGSALGTTSALSEEGRSRGTSGSRRFSFVPDTAWLKAKPESPVVVASSPPSAEGPPLTPQAASSATPAEKDPQPNFKHGTGGSKSLPSVAPPQSAVAVKLTEMEQQLERDMTAAAYPETETDSGEAGEVPAGTFHEPDARSEGANDSEDSDSRKVRRPSADGSVTESLGDLIAESSNMAREEIIPLENGVVDVEEDCLTPTIGSKRDSAGNGVRPEHLLNFSSVIAEPDTAEVTTPSKRWKTDPVYYRLGVMRHSSRLDDAMHERQRNLSTATDANVNDGNRDDQRSRKSSFKNGGNGKDVGENVAWIDRALRPYDTPIVDRDLPASQAIELARHGFGEETLIICSPFRRCLQTAGVVARTLGVIGVTVSLDLGERMDKVRKEISEMIITSTKRRGSDGGLYGGDKRRKPVFSYLDRAGMMEALGEGVELDALVGEQPPEDESGVEAKQRFMATIENLRQNQLRETSILVVAHGDTLDAAGESLASQIVYEADYCAWAVFDLGDNYGYVAESYGVQMIPL